MRFNLSLAVVASFVSLCFATPLSPEPRAKRKPPRLAHGAQKRCGPVSAYYGQRASDWDANDMDNWLNNWWSNHTAFISANSKGFAGAFGEWATGNDMRQAYYTIESGNRLHSYFIGLGQSFQVASIGAALSKDSWATTFYNDKDVKSATVLREVLNALTSVIGIGAAFGGLGGAGVAVASGGLAALFTGAAGVAAPLIGQQ
ncbi:MAG: hypothetical protein Q9221_008247 [Calogaya cf. arnoldii]